MDLNKLVVKDLKSNDESTIRYTFNCVYNKYYKLVCFCISQYVKSKEDIEEIANDSFLNFFNSIKKLDENKNIIFIHNKKTYEVCKKAYSIIQIYATL